MGKVLQLEPSKQRALAMLLEGSSTQDVAAALNVARSTVWRWRTSDPEFIAALANRTSERLEDVRAELEHAAVSAAAYVRAVTDGKEVADQTRLAACRLVLERAVPPTSADPSGREASQKALQSALGGEAEAKRYLGAQLGEIFGLPGARKAGA